MTTAEESIEHMGETSGAANHDHDVIHELSKRLDALWRYDQYIANAKDHGDLAKFWEDIKSQDTDNVARLKGFVRKHIEEGCF